jgi:hypothetical protein
MTINGHIQDGVAVPDTPVQVPDGTPVLIQLVPTEGVFWQNKSAAQHAEEQGVQPIQDVEELAGDWPPEDSIDDFLAFLREIRKR